MSAELNEEAQLEIAHVLFSDLVDYSKLLSDQQREVFQLFNEIVRSTRQSRATEEAGKLVRLATADGIALAFFTRTRGCVALARSASSCGSTRGFNCHGHK